MEEEVEIEQLYKEHGQLLMEAAAAELVDSEEVTRTVCRKEEKVIRVENGTGIAKKDSSNRSRVNLKCCRRKRKTHVPKEVEEDSSGTDFEDLLDNSILSCMANNQINPIRGPEDRFHTGFDRNSESCLNEILGGEYKSREKSPELESSQIESNSSRNSNEMLLLELRSLQNMIDKREDIFINLEGKLKEELFQNESEQRRIREAKNALSHNDTSGSKEPNLTKFYFKKFGIPYFRDSAGFPPPPNNDTKKKLKNSELVMTNLPKLKFWRKCDKDKLQDAIQLTLIKEKSDKLIKEIAKLKAKLEGVTDSKIEKDILDKIFENQNQLKIIRNMSYFDLVSTEDPNREYDWMMYSASDLKGAFSPEECMRFWHLYLKPAINKASWELHEDEKLREVTQKMNCQDWETIAQSMNNNRSAYQCFIHYRNRLSDKQDFVAGKWSKEEDEKLLNVVNSSKIGDFIPWTKVASYMGDRTHNQIYNRYVNSLDPKLVKGRFTMEEDILIVSGIEVFGVTYKEMASLMNNRTSNQIRERYERHLVPKSAKTGTFSLEEDEQLMKLVDKYGEGNFSLVAKEMKTRTRTQVRQRYNNIMRMMRTKPGWTPAQVKRRNIHKVSKSVTTTEKKVETLRKEVERVEKEFVLTKLESDTFRIEKLKELRDKLFMKKYDLKKLKKKTVTENTETNNQLLEFFKYHHLPVNSSIRKNGINNVAYLNEIFLLAKYFGHDIQLPESEEEIWRNNNLSYNLKTFLVETLKKKAETDASKKPNATKTSSTSIEEEHNLDYVEPEVDNTLIMEDCWHNASFSVSNLNFSEFFKRTVFDYSNGMHQDIWDSKVRRSRKALFNDKNVAKCQNHQRYFFPPNSITALGYKSVLLSKTRLKRDSNKLLREQMDVKTENFQNYRLMDVFQDTLLSLFYCPKVLSVTDINSTTLPIVQKSQTSVSVTNCDELVDLLNNSNQNISDVVKKATKPIKDEALQNKKVKLSILEHNKTRQRQLKEYKMGITYGRKMSIEHLVQSDKKQKKISSKTKSRLRNNLKKKIKEHVGKYEAEELNDGSKILKKNGFQDIQSVRNNFDLQLYSCIPVIKIPAVTYSRTSQSVKRHSESDKHSEPAFKKSNCINSENTNNSTQEPHKVCLRSRSRATTAK